MIFSKQSLNDAHVTEYFAITDKDFSTLSYYGSQILGMASTGRHISRHHNCKKAMQDLGVSSVAALAISKSWLNEMPIPRCFAGTEPIEKLCKQLRWDVVPIYFTFVSSHLLLQKICTGITLCMHMGMSVWYEPALLALSIPGPRRLVSGTLWVLIHVLRGYWR